MPDEIKKPGDFTYGVNNKGQIVMDGVVIESNLNTYGGDATSEVPEDDDDTPKDRTNAQVEGKAAEPEKVPEPTPVKPAEPIAEAPKIPEKQKFKLMLKGELLDKEYTNDELVARLQMAESYGIRNDELRQKHRELEPFVHLFQKPEFKAIIQEKMATGELPAPPEAPQASISELARYDLYKHDPDFDSIRLKIAEWADTQSVSVAERLNNSHKDFNDTYDQFKLRMKQSAPQAQPVALVVDKKTIDKSIANKEVLKSQARVESPGGATQVEDDPKRAWEKEDRRLQNAVRSRERFTVYLGRRMDPEDAWVMHRYQKGT